VIIRSHGVSADEISRAESKNLDILDATCPFVKKAQKNAGKLSREGYAVLVVGDSRHPEVKGIVSYVEGEVYVAGSVDDVKKLPHIKKLGVVAQTTQSQENFDKIIDACLNITDNIKICNTICDATYVRQKESLDLADRVDVMLVIGGLSSANTKRLKSLCLDIQRFTYHIESAADIVEAWFEGAEKIGMTAGASTPAYVIEEVRRKVEEICSGKKL